MAPLNVGAEHNSVEDIEAYKDNINKGEFGGRSLGSKSASLPSDAQYSFNNAGGEPGTINAS